MARGIPTHTLPGGHTLRIVDRAPDKAARLAADLQETPQPPDVQAAAVAPGHRPRMDCAVTDAGQSGALFPCYERVPGTHGPPEASPEPAGRISREQRWLRCQFPCWQPLVPTCSAQDLFKLFSDNTV